MTEQPIRVLMVDDHPLIREGLQAVLSQAPGLELVAQASDGIEGLRLARALQPDVILMDLLMPGMNGLAATQAILSEFPRMRVVILTSVIETEQIVAAARMGAVGYVLKNASSRELMQTIRGVMLGKIVLPEPILSALRGGRAPDEAEETESDAHQRLTRREIEIIKLIAAGLGNDEIAERLVISRSTVGVHISNVLNKLRMENRTQVALFAVRRGWAD
jgi:NarL family two-component system response regulator LiaR